MKLRFRNNSLRLRVNQREVDALAAGAALKESVAFPGDSELAYVLEPSTEATPSAAFQSGTVRVCTPQAMLGAWAANEDEIGIYFELAANGGMLKVAIEKDLECVDGPVAERDPEAFPRLTAKTC